MSEIKESLDRAAEHLRDTLRSPWPMSASLQGTLIAILDTLTEIAAVLPAPHTVPKE